MKKIVKASGRNANGMRRAFTLIELLVTISMTAAVMALASVSFYLLMRSERMVTQTFLMERTISRLAERFRDDTHQFESGMITESAPDAAELNLGDSDGIRVRYRITTKGIARLLIDHDSVVARDDFHLPDCHVRFASGNQSESSLRILMIKRPGATLTREANAAKPMNELEIFGWLNQRSRQISTSSLSTTNSENTSKRSDEPQ